MSKAEIRRLQKQLDRLTPAMRQAVLAALETTRESVTLERLQEAIQRGDEFALRALIAKLPRRLERAAVTTTKAVIAGGRAAAISVGIQFNATQPAAVAAAEQQAASMVTGVTRETRNAIRTVVVRAFREQITPRDAAKLIKPLIGLSERQSMAVMTRRATLAAKGWTDARIAKDVQAYADKLLRQRATMIARTEIIRASTTGQIAAWQQAQQDGRLSPSLVKTWIVTPDDKLCPVCEPLDGQQTPVTGTFSTDAGLVLGPPAHPNCRCAIGLTEARAARRVA